MPAGGSGNWTSWPTSSRRSRRRTSRRRVRGARDRGAAVGARRGPRARRGREQALVGDEAIADGVASLAGLLEAVADLDPTADDVARRARGLAAEIAELAYDVRTYREALLPDPERLQAIRERIAALKGPAEVRADRRGGRGVRGKSQSDSPPCRARTTGSPHSSRGSRPLGEARARAAVLTTRREEAAGALGAAVVAELEELGMPEASFEVRLLPVDPPGPGR